MAKLLKWYLILPALIAAVAWTVVYWLCEPAGDDMSYMMTFSSPHGGAWETSRFPHWVVFHWLYSNGRFANNIAAVLLGMLPHPAVALITGAFVGAFFMLMFRYMGLGAARLSDAAPKAFLAFAMMYFGMAWWNAFSMIDVTMNYIGSMVLILTVLWLWEKPCGLWGRAAVMLLSVAAGAMHEAASWPVIAGLIFSRICNDRPADNRRRLYFFAFVAGAVWTLSSPGIWHRAAAGSALYESYPSFVLRTLPFTTTMVIVSAVCLARRSWRSWFVSRICGPDALWYVAALAGTSFVIYGRVTGRSGWFCESFSLIVLFRWILLIKWKIPRMAAYAWMALCPAVTAVQIYYMLEAAWRYSEADRERNALYRGSPDGIVYYDYPDWRRESLFALGRVRTQDDTDPEIRNVLMLYYKGGPLAVLPTEARGFDPATAAFADTLHGVRCHVFADGSALSRSLPADAEPFVWEWMDNPAALMWLWRYPEPVPYVVKPVKLRGCDLYYIAPIRFGPGSK